MAKRHIHNEKSCSKCLVDFHVERTPFWKERESIVMAISFIFLILGLYMEFVIKDTIVGHALFLAVIILSGHEIIVKGIKSLMKKRLDMSFLMTIAAFGAFIIGEAEEGATVMFLFFIAEFLEEHAAEKAKNSVAALLKLAPENALVRIDGKEVKVHAHDIEIGDIVIVKPGDRIPLDGIVVSGESSINQAPITGESAPIQKLKGDIVYAGTMNNEGYLEIKTTKPASETVVAKIAKLVQEAQEQKSGSEKFIDKFAGFYTPIVISLALLVAIVPPLAFSLPFNDWVYKSLILLVVACPCALTISTPVSMISSITGAARQGILIKGGIYLEEMGKIKTYIFDKTGTLTEGNLEVTDILPFGLAKRELLSIAASLESMSKHPSAEAVMRKAKQEKIKPKKVTGFKSITGKGLRGMVGGKTYFIGNRKLFKSVPEKEIEKLESEGKTVFFIGTNSKLIGIIAVMDKVRDNAKETIRMLKKMGIEPIMISGDSERVTKAAASELGITHYHGEMLPEDKIKEVKSLRRKYKNVVMIGDGVNDAPALAQANIGIAMGSIGSDVALETADIVLMHDDLSKLVYLSKLSRKTTKVVRENVAASVIIKGSFAVLAFPGLISLWLAVAIGDMGLSLGVICNAFRLQSRKLSRIK